MPRRRFTTANLPVPWGWYSVTAGAAPKTGGAKSGLVVREDAVFWAAWWTADPRRAKRAPSPDAFGFVQGAKAEFVAGCEAESRIRRERPRAYVLAIPGDFARAAYRDGAPRLRSRSTDFAKVAAAWRKERGLPREALPAAIKRAWREWLKKTHAGAGAEGIDLEVERRRYEAALAHAVELETQRLRTRQMEQIARGERPVDLQAIAKRVKAIAAEVRAKLDVIARRFGLISTLAGLCHFAALGLVEALRAAGLHAVVASQGGHSWAHVLVDDSDPILADVTASQYGRAPVYVRLPGQLRRWPHDQVRARGHRAKSGVEEVAAHVFERMPAMWWALSAAELPSAMSRANTQLGWAGLRVQTERVA